MAYTDLRNSKHSVRVPSVRECDIALHESVGTQPQRCNTIGWCCVKMKKKEEKGR